MPIEIFVFALSFFFLLRYIIREKRDKKDTRVVLYKTTRFFVGIGIIGLLILGSVTISLLLLFLLLFFLFASGLYSLVNLTFHRMPEKAIYLLAEKLGENFLIVFTLYIKFICEIITNIN